MGQVDCASCKGTGVKVQKSTLGSRTESIPLPSGARCIVCGDRPAVSMHHICKQSRLNVYADDETLRATKQDPRNGVPACVHCHGGLDDESIQLQPHQLPRGFWDFVATYNVEGALPRYLACGTVARTQPGTVPVRVPSREVPR